MAVLSMEYVLQDVNLHAIDWDGPITTEHNEDVEVPSTARPINTQDFQNMTELINPLSYSSEHGIDLYLQCLSFVQARMMYI